MARHLLLAALAGSVTAHRGPAAFAHPRRTNRGHRPVIADGASPLSSSAPNAWRPYESSRCHVTHPASRTAVHASPSPLEAASLIARSNEWGNVAALAFTASLAQLLGKTTLVGKLLGAPVTAMALTFVLSSVGWIPTLSAPGSWRWNTLLPPGGSPASAFVQGISLTLATPLLLLGTSVRGPALKQCGALLGSFVIASLGTLTGATLAFGCHLRPALMAALPGGDGIKIAAALLAKNVGGGINYMAVATCLNASTESIAAGLCVDNVMALIYFPAVSLLASKYGDVSSEDAAAENAETEDIVDSSDEGNDSSPIEALSHAFTLAAALTALGQLLNSKLHHLPKLLGRAASSDGASPPNLSLPITTLLAVLFSTYYPPNIFLSPTTTTKGESKINTIAKAGETLGTSLLYLFFATAGAPGWRLKDSIQQSFPAIASFLVILYGVHGGVLWGMIQLVEKCTNGEGAWKNVVAPQRLLVASSAAIGGPATAAALAKSFHWESLLTPSLLVGNVGYAVATFIGLIFYGVFR